MVFDCKYADINKIFLKQSKVKSGAINDDFQLFSKGWALVNPE